MTSLSIYHVDAFTNQVFKGNPAAICVLEDWLSDDLMQQIAAENNLAETAFIVKENDQFLIRWFTPTVEDDLCGHATLAAAFILERFFYPNVPLFNFYSHRSGKLPVYFKQGLFTLDFPVDNLIEINCPNEIKVIFKQEIIQCFKGKTDYLLVFKSESEVQEANPNMNDLIKIDCRGIIITAPGLKVDFVSRFFGPKTGVNEDPVTGSAHTTLAPFWSNKLNKKKLTAHQISNRGGVLLIEDCGERILISGEAVLYLQGNIFY